MHCLRESVQRVVVPVGHLFGEEVTERVRAEAGADALQQAALDGFAEAVQCFHLDALSSIVGLKVDFDLRITLMAGKLLP